AEVVDAHVAQRQQLARELVSLADGDLRRVTVNEEHDAQVDLRHRRRVIVQEPEQLDVELAPVDDLLLPLAAQPILDRVSALQVTRADVAPDYEGVLLAQTALGRPAQPLRELVMVEKEADD